MTIIHQILIYPNQFLDFIHRHIFLLKLISNLLSAIFLIGIFYCILGSQFLTFQVERWIDILNIKTLSKRRAIRGWRQIQRRLKKGDVTNLKLAILEADRIFDEILKLSGLSGETMDDRLQQATDEQITNLEQLKQAHRVANRINKDPDFIIDRKLTYDIIKIYKELFNEFGLV